MSDVYKYVPAGELTEGDEVAIPQTYTKDSNTPTIYSGWGIVQKVHSVGVQHEGRTVALVEVQLGNDYQLIEVDSTAGLLVRGDDSE